MVDEPEVADKILNNLNKRDIERLYEVITILWSINETYYGKEKGWKGTYKSLVNFLMYIHPKVQLLMEDFNLELQQKSVVCGILAGHFLKIYESDYLNREKKKRSSSSQIYT